MLIDTLRADGLGLHGNPRGNSPVIDAIAAESVVFERAIAQSPWTQPSVASIFCSRYPGAHRVLDFGKAVAGTALGRPRVAVFNASIDTLAESLKSGGYHTAAFVANPFIHPEFGFAQGFDHFDCSFAKNTTPGSVVNEAAIAWLGERGTKKTPFFLFLHYMDPHGPYDTAPEFLAPLLDGVETVPNKRRLLPDEIKRLDYLRRLPTVCADRRRHERLGAYREYWVARYEAGIRQIDQSIGELRRRLIEMNVWNDALLIITSDHGEALCEHGHWEHGFSAHHPELHVPLILRWPGILPVGKRLRSNVELIDLMPTLIDALGLHAPAAMQGKSLWPYLTQGRSPAPAVAFAEGIKVGPEQRAVYLGDFKLLLHATTERWELYNFVADPLEQADVAAQRPKLASELAGLIRAQTEHNAHLADGIEAQSAPLSREHYERLRSLGYFK